MSDQISTVRASMALTTRAHYIAIVEQCLRQIRVSTDLIDGFRPELPAAALAQIDRDIDAQDDRLLAAITGIDPSAINCPHGTADFS